ncbi:10465_t:CDS:2, partial [Gigaspora rosea]
NDNLVKGETFEREVLERFKNLAMFSICFPCTPYLLNDGKLLFSNGDHQAWAIRVGKMNNTDGPGPENMEEDYEYINRHRITVNHLSGFLIPVQCKFRSNENMQRYDPNIKYEGGNKTLNHYLTDFDSLLDRMIFDKTEVNFNIRYGIYIISSNVHIPERFPRTRNVIMVIHDFDINIENIRMFFNRIRSRNYNSNLKNTESRILIASPFETSINSTDREILIAQTDILDRELRKCASNVYWARNQDNLMAREFRERQQKYLSVNQFGVRKKENIDSEENIQNDTFDMSSLSEALDQTEASEEQFDIYKIIASLNKKK